MSLLLPHLLKSPRRSQMLHTCVECGFATPRRRAYEKHLRACESARSASGRTLPDPPVCRNYRCHHCGSCTNKAKLFLYHLRDVHGENMSVFACDLCEYASRHKHKVFRHRKLVHKGAEPLTDLLPVDSEDSQDTGVMAMDSDVIHNDVSMDNADDTYDAEDEDGRVVNGNSQLLVNENSEVIDESVLGVYVVNPEPVDDDIDLTEVNDSFIEHQEGGVTLNSRRQNTVASRGKPSSSNSDNRVNQQQQQQQHVMFKCRMCPYTNPYKWKIAQHARTIHMRKTMYRCAQCNFTCERKIEWCVHKTKHSKKAVHSCDECAYSTTMKRNFDRHMRRHSNGGPIKCSMCTYASTGEAAVQRHMAEFHPSATAAATAGAGGNAVLKLANFVNTSTSARSVKTKTEHASAAAASSRTVKRLNHYQSFSTQGQGFLDDDNDEGRDSDQSMSIDIHTITDDIPAAHGGPALAHAAHYSCRFCQARFRDLFVLKNHVFVKHGEEACSDNMHWNTSDKSQQDQPLDLSNKDTDREWSTSDALDDDQPLDLSAQGQQGLEQVQGHVGLNQLIIGDMKYEAFDGPMKCAHCNYSASWPSDLQRHMMVHSLERRFRCHLCGRRYKHQFDLNAHLRRVHRVPAGRTATQLPGVSPTAGHILGALLNDRQSLTVLRKPTPAVSPATRRTGVVTSESAVEIRVAAARKPSPVPGEAGDEKLRCEFCNYVGKYRAEVERHMRLHTGDKPFACLFCPYRSFWKGDMKRHLVKHHPAEVDSCPDLKGMVNDTELLGQQRAKEDRVTDHQSVQSESVYQSLSPAGSSQLSFDDGDRQFEVKVAEDDVSEENTTSSDNIPSSSSPLVFTEKQVFKCTQCPFHCDAPSKLKCHAEIHANLKRFKCPECGKRSNWTWDIKKHIRKDHVDQTLEVIELSEEEARASLPLYMSTHRTCGRSGSESKESTPVREGVQRTMPAPAATASAAVSAADSVVVKETDAMIEGDKSLALLKPFKCSQCTKQSNWKWDIQKHIRAAHAESGGKVIVIKGNKAPLNRPLASRSSLGKALSDRAKAKAQQHVAMELGGSSSSNSRSLKPLSLQPSDLIRSVSTERFRPFRCSECGKRSNWKWDLNKHIASYHGNEAHIETMTEDEARDTFDEYLRQQQKEKGLNSSTGDDDMADFSEGNLEKHVANLNVAISLLSPQCDDSLQTTGSFHTPVTKTHHSKDAKKQKKFKCSVCEYRSNYRSDIQRHLKRRHSDDVDASVVELSDREAAATLTEYRKVFGAKKFVSPDKSSTVLNGIYSAAAADEAANNSSENEDISMSDDEANNVSSDLNAVDVTPDTMGDGDNELWVKVTATESGAGSKGRGRHFCEWCPYVSINRNDYIYHKQFHRAKSSAAFKCDLCPYWVTQKRLLKQHEKVHQPQYKLRYYPSARLAAEPQVNEAVVQSSVTCSQAEPIDRKTESAEMEFASSEMYKCMRCPYTSASADRIVEHNARHSAQSSEGGNSKDLCCNYCDYRAVSEESLSVHETVHAESYRSGVDVGSESEETAVPAEDGDGNDEDDEWKCDLCPFHTMQYTRFEKHLLLHRTTDNEVKDCPSVPSDTATTADIGDALLLMNDHKCAPDAGEGRSGAAIFPEHSSDEPDVTNVVTYDVNANVAEKIIVNSTATEMAEQVA